MRAAGSSPCVGADSSFNVRCNVADPEQGKFLFLFLSENLKNWTLNFNQFSIFRHLSRSLSRWHVDLYYRP